MKSAIKNKSILIIDDDDALLRAMSKVLAEEGARVMCATWVGEAIAQINDNLRKLDLIVTDLRMPVVSGQTVIDALGVALPQVPVIVITAFGDPQIEAECLAAGAAAFLEKPLDTPQLISTIERVLSPSNREHQGGAGRQYEAKKKTAAVPASRTGPFIDSIRPEHETAS